MTVMPFKKKIFVKESLLGKLHYEQHSFLFNCISTAKIPAFNFAVNQIKVKKCEVIHISLNVFHFPSIRSFFSPASISNFVYYL